MKFVDDDDDDDDDEDDDGSAVTIHRNLSQTNMPSTDA